jgi:hypothetical protein
MSDEQFPPAVHDSLKEFAGLKAPDLSTRSRGS